MIVFEIDEVIDVDGAPAVLGLASQGDVHVGTLFTKICSYDPVHGPFEGREATIELLAKRINAYNRDIEILPEGYAGGIVIDGVGYDLLRGRSYIVASK